MSFTDLESGVRHALGLPRGVREVLTYAAGSMFWFMSPYTVRRLSAEPMAWGPHQPFVQGWSFSGFRIAQMRLIRPPAMANAYTVTVMPSS
jgi:hypothetical protein